MSPSALNLRVYFAVVLFTLFLQMVFSASIASTRPPVSDEVIDKALQDKRYLMRQLKCAIGEAPCDPVGKRLKSLAPFVLRGNCPQCSPTEVSQIRRTLAYVQKTYPAEWTKLIQAYAG
ncbi:ejaculatory bulb-specific protein 3-like isoform X2 [Lutzomyia longipalpis]|uniref:Putative insect pheromone-binding family n=1 Tax=Lutzomyia longipalpis TaxID=7200 RepID=A0A7G3AP04_LUTLO|nr:ejaculatory bulb-specific protein 3-like isoform X2 [Lutzomyia longipalpis]